MLSFAESKKQMTFQILSLKKARAAQYLGAEQGWGGGNLHCLAEVLFIAFKWAHLKGIFMQQAKA